MNVFTTEKIRNVAILGHGGAGKTSLVEGMAFLSGLTNRLGNITDGNTISDYDKEEQKRKFSINTSVVPIVWNDTKINILDTPGYFDFVGEVEEAVAAADAAVIVINGKSGVEVGAQKAWDVCERFGIPRIFWVSNMDYEHANYHAIVADLQNLYGKKVVPTFIPIHEGDKYIGYVNVVKNRARRYTDKQNKVECEIPAHLMDDYQAYNAAVMDAVAETSEELMERYFEGDTFTEEEVITALRQACAEGSIVPIMPGSGINLQGILILLDDMVNYFPNPGMCRINGDNVSSGEEFEADYDVEKPKSAFVFKTLTDGVGKYSLIKVTSGKITPEDTLYEPGRALEFRVGKLYTMLGNKPSEIKELHAGDIGAIAKLDVATGDTLSTKAVPVKYHRIRIPVPYTYKQYIAGDKADDDKISSALTKLCQEDPTMKVVNDAENHQSLIYGMGDQHLDIIVSKLLNRYKVDITLEQPRVAFRETIRKKADVDSKYKKQSGGHGQYGHVKMTFEPSGDMESAYVFDQIVVGGAVPKNFFPAVEKGIQESVVKGPLAGYPVVGVKATLYDGSYHPVDSSEMAFKTAASMAFKDAFMKAGPVLLEPIASLKVTVPDKYTGDVMGDLNKRRGRVLGMNPATKGNTVVEADIPMSELYGYSTQLRSMTGGSGVFEYEFARYEQAPSDVQEKEVKARAEEASK